MINYVGTYLILRESYSHIMGDHLFQEFLMRIYDLDPLSEFHEKFYTYVY